MKLLVDAHCFDYQTTEGINTYLKGLYGELVGIAPDIDFLFCGAKCGQNQSLVWGSGKCTLCAFDLAE